MRSFLVLQKRYAEVANVWLVALRTHGVGWDVVGYDFLLLTLADFFAEFFLTFICDSDQNLWKLSLWTRFFLKFGICCWIWLQLLWSNRALTHPNLMHLSTFLTLKLFEFYFQTWIFELLFTFSFFNYHSIYQYCTTDNAMLYYYCCCCLGDPSKLIAF